MEYYMDENWKLSKEDRPSKPSISRSFSQRSSNKSSLHKSSSQKNPFTLSRSKSSHQRSSSQRCSEFTRKCKEQKAKFYIVKRCISMLVSWKKNDDS